jgi:tyrosinase
MPTHTPLDVPGYAAVFGHGECFGGPGHCEIPPAENRKFDLRERSMNTRATIASM